LFVQRLIHALRKKSEQIGRANGNSLNC